MTHYETTKQISHKDTLFLPPLPIWDFLPMWEISISHDHDVDPLILGIIQLKVEET